MNIRKSQQTTSINIEISKLKQLISEKENVIKKLKEELDIIKNQNSENNNLSQQIHSIENDLIQLKNDKDELIKQNDQIRSQLSVKENYIISLNATIIRLKNLNEVLNKNIDKYKLLSEKNKSLEDELTELKKNFDEKNEIINDYKKKNEEINKTNEGLVLQIKKLKLEKNEIEKEKKEIKVEADANKEFLEEIKKENNMLNV